MGKRLLPIGFQTFREVRERDCYYVDKTGFAVRLANEGKHYFLSRPRRFGKSLFLDTLKELFEGNRDLFEGLEAYDQWDWSARHPVVKLSFGKGDFADPDYLHKNVMGQLAVVERQSGVEARHDTAPERFDRLLRRLHARTGQRAVVLIDEYDKPILDALRDERVARANRDYLVGLYSTIKNCDAHVGFSFLAGVSKFSKVTLFSGLNHLIDITLEPQFSSICGYTESDLEIVFAPELEGLDRDQVRDWYNGYRWGGEEQVYNPFDVLLLFRKREFRAWWFETGTPTFLVETLVNRAVPTLALDGMVVREESLGTFDVGRIGTEALLFQTGYLTVLESEDRWGLRMYRLGYPNREVRQSLNESLLDALTGDRARWVEHSNRLGQALEEGDTSGLERVIHALFAGIPYQWHSRNEIAHFEGYYASVFYSHLAGLGFEITVEESGSRGRADMALRTGDRVYLFEFKVLEQAGPEAAMARMKQRGYAEKYRHLQVPIHLVAVEFSAEEKNVAGFEVAAA